MAAAKVLQPERSRLEVHPQAITESNAGDGARESAVGEMLQALGVFKS
ncbi:hypothetical protein H6G93_30235 [Nostoc sp. FACHB-973]|nr:hypothetical protein [Nostoc sp. FACHB-973]